MEEFQLTMTGCGMDKRLRDFRVRSPDEFKITQRIIACTFSFKNLTALTISSECSEPVCQTLRLTDNDIDLLTRTIPGLESLAVGGEPCGVLSWITLKSLYTISRRCVRLTVLRIHFDPTSFVTKVGKDPEFVDVALGLPDLKVPSPSHDLRPVMTIDVGKFLIHASLWLWDCWECSLA